MKIYVTGGTGFIGSNILKVALERHGADGFSTYHSRPPANPVPFGYEQVDMRNKNQVLESVRRYQPDAIVHSAILKGFAHMYADRVLAWQSYVDATRNMVHAANDVGAKLILISTDWVYDGTQAHADEHTPPNPINYYGVLKVVSETVVADLAHDWAVARVAAVNGVHWWQPVQHHAQDAGFGSLANVVVQTLSQGKPFTVWEGEVNERASPTLASEIGEMVMQIIVRDRQGIFHCCGGESISRFDLAQMTAEVFELDGGLLRRGPVDPQDPGSLAGYAVPRDTSLNNDFTAQQLDYTPLSVRQMLTKLRQQLETGALI